MYSLFLLSLQCSGTSTQFRNNRALQGVLVVGWSVSRSLKIPQKFIKLTKMYRVIEPGKVAIVFGAITMMSGIIGVPLGMFLSTELKVNSYIGLLLFTM